MSVYCMECGKRVSQMFRDGKWAARRCAVHPVAMVASEGYIRKKFRELRAAVEAQTTTVLQRVA